MNKQQSTFGIILAALAILLIYLLNKAGLLHESVTTSIANGAITPQGTVTPDPATGLPRYYSNVTSTLPTGIALAVAPIDVNGNITNRPTKPLSASCPAGYQLYKDETTGTFMCIPISQAVIAANAASDYALTGA